MISNLQSILDEHGDIPAVYSSDDECNDFHSVSWCGSIKYTENINDYYLEMLDPKEVMMGMYENQDITKVVCIN